MAQVVTINDTSILASDDQVALLDQLMTAHAGFATLHNYHSTTGYVEPKISTVTINAKVTPAKVYANDLEALKSISLEDVAPMLTDWKPFEGRKNDNNRPTLPEQFDRCMEMLVNRCEGNGSAQHVKAHDDNSVSVNGIKIWLEKGDGPRSIKSILVYGLPVSETVHDKGVRKPNNAGSKVQVDQAIEKVWNQRQCSIRSYNVLKAEKVTIGGEVI